MRVINLFRYIQDTWTNTQTGCDFRQTNKKWKQRNETRNNIYTRKHTNKDQTSRDKKRKQNTLQHTLKARKKITHEQNHKNKHQTNRKTKANKRNCSKTSEARVLKARIKSLESETATNLFSQSHSHRRLRAISCHKKLVKPGGQMADSEVASVICRLWWGIMDRLGVTFLLRSWGVWTRICDVALSCFRDDWLLYVSLANKRYA